MTKCCFTKQLCINRASCFEGKKKVYNGVVFKIGEQTACTVLQEYIKTGKRKGE